jgi:hypothetical protein
VQQQQQLYIVAELNEHLITIAWANLSIMTKVFILDARKLLSQGQAAVFRRYPFTIILKESLNHSGLEQLGYKINPNVNQTSTT